MNTKLNTFSKLLKHIKTLMNLEDQEAVENHHFTELIDKETYQAIEDLSKGYTLTDNDYFWLIGVYGNYNYCKNKDEVKEQILIDAIEENLFGIKSSFTKIRKERVAEARY